MWTKILNSFKRPLKILSHPIVMISVPVSGLHIWDYLSIYTNMQGIYGEDYGFDTEQIGLLFLGTGPGFLSAVWFFVPRIDTVYNVLGKRYGGGGPGFRLPLANVGTVLIPISLFRYVMEYTLWAAVANLQVGSRGVYNSICTG